LRVDGDLQKLKKNAHGYVLPYGHTFARLAVANLRQGEPQQALSQECGAIRRYEGGNGAAYNRIRIISGRRFHADYNCSFDASAKDFPDWVVMHPDKTI